MPNMPATLAAPLAGVPDGTGMWRTAVRSVNPYVAVAIPTVIPGDPVVTGTLCRNHFDRARWGRTDADNELRAGNGGADGEEQG
jgi:hypothetical protein